MSFITLPESRLHLRGGQGNPPTPASTAILRVDLHDLVDTSA